MSLYIRVQNSFWNHRKTIKLRSVLGDDALWIMPRLWSYAAENQPDGNFAKYDSNMLAVLIGCQKHASNMLQALHDAEFMDADGKLHNWQEHNGYHAAFAARAKDAAEARWSKKEVTKKETSEDMTGKEMKGKEPSIASRMPQACYKHNSSNDGSETPLKADLSKRVGKYTDLVASIIACRPEFSRLIPEDVAKELADAEAAGIQDITERVGQFCRDVANAVKPPDRPVALLRGYLNSEKKAKRKEYKSVL